MLSVLRNTSNKKKKKKRGTGRLINGKRSQNATSSGGSIWTQKSTGDFWSSGNVLYHFLGGSYTSACIYKNVLSSTLQIYAHHMPHLCVLYLNFRGLEFLNQKGRLPLCLQTISYNSASVTSSTKVSVLKITWVLTLRRGLYGTQE